MINRVFVAMLVPAVLLGATAMPASAAVTFNYAQIATFSSVQTNVYTAPGGNAVTTDDSDSDYAGAASFADTPLATSTSAAVTGAGATASATNSNSLAFVNAGQGLFSFSTTRTVGVTQPDPDDGFQSNAQAFTSYFLNNYYTFTTDTATTIDIVFATTGSDTTDPAAVASQYYYLFDDINGTIFGNEDVAGAATRHFDLGAGQYTLYLGGENSVAQSTRQDGVGIGSHSVTGTLAFVVGAPSAVPGAVPEPITWATMVAGFGLIGGALRRGGRTACAVAC